MITLLLPLLLQGVIIKTKALFAGRVGAPLLQPYHDVIKLLQKGFVFSRTTTWVFALGTIANLVAIMIASLIVPFGHVPYGQGGDMPMSFAGDVILLAYLLALSRFFLTLAALDTGSSFEGMGAAREVTFACLAEPTMFFGFLSLAVISGSTSLEGMLGTSLAGAWHSGAAALLLVLVSWFIVLLAENSRIPFDDPNTHLELTMIHEVIVLDHSGPVLGMVLYAAAVKMFLFAALVVRVAVPFSTGVPLLDWIVFLAGVLGVAVLVGVVESTMARYRMPEIPKVLATACALSALALLLLASLGTPITQN